MLHYTIEKGIKIQSIIEELSKHPNLAPLFYKDVNGDFKSMAGVPFGDELIADDGNFHERLVNAMERYIEQVDPNMATFQGDTGKLDIAMIDIVNQVISNPTLENDAKFVYDQKFATEMRAVLAQVAEKKEVKIFDTDGVNTVAFKIAAAIEDINPDELSRFKVLSQIEKRNQETQKNKELRDPVTAKLTELASKLDDPQTTEEIKNYFKQFAKFHNYSYFNTMLVAHQAGKRGANVERLAPFTEWSAMKGENDEHVKVNKGEVGYKIFVPAPYTIYKRGEDGEYLKNEKNEPIPELDENGKEKTGLNFKIGTVFDVNQTNAKEIGVVKSLEYRNKEVDVSPELLFMVANKVSEVYKLNVEFEDIKGGAKGYYSYFQDKIGLDNKPDKTPAMQLSTLFHELGHHLVHGKMLKNKDLTYKEMHDDKGRREGEAESVSYVLSQQFGIENNSELYIKAWGNSKNDLESMFKTVTDAVNKANKDLNLDQILTDYHNTKNVSLNFENEAITDIKGHSFNLSDLRKELGEINPGVASVNVVSVSSETAEKLISNYGNIRVDGIIDDKNRNVSCAELEIDGNKYFIEKDDYKANIYYAKDDDLDRLKSWENENTKTTYPKEDKAIGIKGAEALEAMRVRQAERKAKREERDQRRSDQRGGGNNYRNNGNGGNRNSNGHRQ